MLINMLKTVHSLSCLTNKGRLQPAASICNTQNVRYVAANVTKSILQLIRRDDRNLLRPIQALLWTSRLDARLGLPACRRLLFPLLYKGNRRRLHAGNGWVRAGVRVTCQVGNKHQHNRKKRKHQILNLYAC